MPTVQHISEVANVVTALAAVGALAAAAWQVREAKRSQREATAAELYANYLGKAIEYPQYANASAWTKHAGPPSDDTERYEWFVSLMLHVFEQILELTRGDETWQKTVRDQIAYHGAYISSPAFVRHHYSDDLQTLFREIAA